jgi:hypothetical protein
MALLFWARRFRAFARRGLAPSTPRNNFWWLAHPIPIGAALLLFLNDHFFKGAGIVPAWLTGKLSDVCGLFVLPVLIACFTERRAVVCIGVAIGFALVKTEPHANAMWTFVFGKTLIDPTDLLALPSVALAYAWMHRQENNASNPYLGRFAAMVSGVACMATSAVHKPEPPRAPPIMVARGNPCAEVVLDGIEPHGEDVAIHFRAKSQSDTPCLVTFDRVALFGQLTSGTQFTAEGRSPPVRVDPKGTAAIAVFLQPPYKMACDQNARVSVDYSEDTDPPSGGFSDKRAEASVSCVKTQPLISH